MPEKNVKLSDSAFLTLWCANERWVHWSDQGRCFGSINPERGKGTRAILRVPVVLKLIAEGLAEKSGVNLVPTQAGQAILKAESGRTVAAGVGHKPFVTLKGSEAADA